MRALGKPAPPGAEIDRSKLATVVDLPEPVEPSTAL
jgi:hypothetical protein